MEPELKKMISIITVNRVGVLTEITKELGSANINIDAIVGEGLAETGLIRIITKDIERAEKILKDKGFNVIVSDVIVVKIPNKPGQLMEITNKLAQKKVDINFIYLESVENNIGEVMIKPDNIERALKALEK